MPIPIPGPSPEEASPVPSPALPSVARPYSLREPQGWVVEQERQHHNQALYLLGEWVFFLLMWREIDFKNGLVGRCSRCYPATDSRERRLAAVYDQPVQGSCPVCFGTTFEGGFRARIVRPAIVTDTEETERQDRRGVVHPAGISIESTWDFRAHNGDYMIRADNSRWQLSAVQRHQIRPGFEHARMADQHLGVSAQANREEEAQVSYAIPPTSKLLIRTVLTRPMRGPGNFIEHEDMRGPLIPDNARVD